MTPGQGLVNDFAQNGRSPQTTADPHAGKHFTLIVAIQVQTNIVYLNHRTVAFGTMHGNFELAGQESKFRMESAPLANDLGQRAGIHHFVRGNAGKLVGRGVADTVTRSLDGVHFHFSQSCQYIGHAIHGNPVVLQVVPRRKVSVALIFFTGDGTQHA